MKELFKKMKRQWQDDFEDIRVIPMDSQDCMPMVIFIGDKQEVTKK